MDVSFTNVLEGARQYFQGLPSTSSAAGPYFQHQQNAQPRQGADQHHGNPSSGAAAHWQQQQPQHNPSDPNRPPTREHTPIQRPPSGSRPPSHPAQYQEVSRQYHNSYPQERQAATQSPQTQLGFQFTRPQSRETPNHQYQPHIVTSSPYHASESSQLTVAQSREQMTPAGQSYQQTYQQQAQYAYQRPYYQCQPKTATNYAVGQYQSTSHNTSYYKQKSYSTPTSVISSQGSGYPDPRGAENAIQQNYQNPTGSEQPYRTTHNLPPIAALSNYHSSRNTKEQTKVALPRTRLPSSSSYSHATPSPSIQQTSTKRDIYPTSSGSGYAQYRTPPINQNQQHAISQVNPSSSQPYSNVIMTMANTSYYSTTSSQHQASSQGYYNRPKTEVRNLSSRPQSNENGSVPASNYNRANVITEPTVIKQKRESPLDLSVKTVRTSADSTEEDVSNISKFIHNKIPSGSVANHGYPTLDINKIQRNLTHKSQGSTTVTAPKVEFQPNFNIPRQSGWPTKTPEEAPRKNVYEQVNDYKPDYRQVAYQETVKPPYHNGQVTTNVCLQAPPKSSTTVRTDYVSNVGQKPIQQIYTYDNRDTTKRPSEVAVTAVPHKMAKIDNWRQSIDNQIEQKLSNYKQQQMLAQQQPRQSANSIPTAVISQGYPEQNYQQTAQTYIKQNSRPNQAHNPEAGSLTSQYPTYSNISSKHLYLNPAARTNSSPHLATTSRQTVAGTVDKRVLNLLRNSIEVKEQKKLEQQKSHDVVTQRSDVQQPSTDVKAPLQPKPGIDRNNVSPIPPTSVQEIKGLTSTANAIMNGSSSDIQIDVLQTFLEIRVRTKGELKQLHSENNNTAPDAIIKLIIEDPLNSPQKQNMQQLSNCSSTTNGSVSPPKLLKERQSTLAPRKRLFSRNEDDTSKNGVPTRDKSGLRSSSETSVFDFPDSEDENEMPVLERQSLESMRRDRRNSLKPTTGTSLSASEVETKVEPLSRPNTPEDDIFGSLCDTFMEQLKKAPMKRVKRKKDPESETKIKTEVDTLPSTDVEVTVKQEPAPESEIVKPLIKEEIKSEPNSGPENMPDVIMSNCRTPIGNIIKSDSDSDSEIKKDSRLTIRNKRRVRRKVISSSDSSDEDENKSELKQLEVKLEQTTSAEETKPVEEKKVEEKIGNKQEQTEETKLDASTESIEPRRPSTDLLSIVRPAKKPLFGDGSDFYPGWEEEVCNYKKSLRMPPSLIQITRPPASMRLSTSLPDLDPCPQSPTPSIMTDVDNKETGGKKTIKKFKSEPLDSDSESTSSFNLFSKKTNYDSEGSSSIKSLPNTKMENLSILDRLLEKCGGKRKRKIKRIDDHSPKVIPKAENAVELLPTPTPGLAVSEKSPEKSKGITSPVINAKSAVLPFRKDTVNNFKDAFIHSGSSILGVHDKFTTVVLSSRTRKQTRAMKQRATIKEVFGEDRPASAPPVTCVNDVEIKEELPLIEPFSKNLEEILIKKESENAHPDKSDLNKTVHEKLNNAENTNLLKDMANRRIKEEILDEDAEDENKRLIEFIKRDFDTRSETASLDGDESSVSGKRRSKFGKMRRKLSSGFDYIRKKKKVKKEESENSNVERTKKRVVTKTPESIDDIQKEIKSWVLNKGVGETHLHRAARLGYADITAYCLERMDCTPSPKDNAGYTPLHEACIRGHLEIAKLLLRYGASVHESAQGGIRKT